MLRFSHFPLLFVALVSIGATQLGGCSDDYEDFSGTLNLTINAYDENWSYELYLEVDANHDNEACNIFHYPQLVRYVYYNGLTFPKTPVNLRLYCEGPFVLSLWHGEYLMDISDPFYAVDGVELVAGIGISQGRFSFFNFVEE